MMDKFLAANGMGRLIFFYQEPEVDHGTGTAIVSLKNITSGYLLILACTTT